MKNNVTIHDENTINCIIQNANYGTMALCLDNKPYNIPFNYVKYDDCIYIHGAKKGKKIDIIKQNCLGSFSIVEDYSLLPSYFSTDSGDASPATHLFSSVIIDGEIQIIEDYDEKINALQALMKKYQPEGQYKPLNDKKMYEKMINATGLFKLIPQSISGKVKLGQNWNKEKFDRIIKNLKERGSKKDLDTIAKMKNLSMIV